jgi:hypothetical protein
MPRFIAFANDLPPVQVKEFHLDDELRQFNNEM